MAEDDELDSVLADRVSELIETLKTDNKWIDDVIDAADVPNTNANVRRVEKMLSTIAQGLYDLI